jgi:CheY-like chemotaxis protein
MPMSTKLFAHFICADEAFITRQRELLTQLFDLAIFRNVAECRSALGDRRPDFILLDMGLPGDAGFALHRELRDDFDLSDIYQVLICTPDSAAREGLDADDLLVAPVADAVLSHRLNRLIRDFDAKAAAREQMAYAQNVAFTSMSAMGELGVVMQFLSRSFACHNIQSVAALAVDTLRQYDLEGAVYLVWEGDGLAQTTNGGELPNIHRDLIEQRRTLGRLLEIDRNLVVNYDHVTLLITNLPEDDAQRLGRIRDNIATLAEGIESRILGLLLEHDNILKQQGIRYAAYEIRDSVRNLDVRQTEDLIKTRDLVNQVIDEFELAFLDMGMAPETENRLIGELVDLRRRITAIVGRPGDAHEKLKVVIAALETLAGQVSETKDTEGRSNDKHYHINDPLLSLV